MYPRLQLIALGLALLSGCSLDFLSQKRVHFSEHSAHESSGVTSFSYPSTLRASTIFFSLSPSTPAEVRRELIGLSERLTATSSAYELCAASSRPKKVGGPTYDCRTEQSALTKARSDLENLSGRWGNVRILAEPPPDVTAASNMNLELGSSTDVASAVAFQLGLGLGENIHQSQLSKESDVKRHLAYRLSEALINYPELMADHYPKLMSELINYTPAPDAASPSLAEDGNDRVALEGPLSVIPNITDEVLEKLPLTIPLDQLGVDGLRKYLQSFSSDMTGNIQGVTGLVVNHVAPLRLWPGDDTEQLGVLKYGSGVKELDPGAAAKPGWALVEVPQPGGAPPIRGWVKKSAIK